MIDVNDEAAVLEILQAAQISVDQLSERTLIDSRGRVVTLRLNPCIGLQELPSCVGDLSQLEEVYLFWGGSGFVTLPTSIERLTKLKILQLRWCVSINSLPTSLGMKLTNLEELVLEGCNNLQDVLCLKQAKDSWVHLKTMRIVSCANVDLTEIFRSGDENEEENNKKNCYPSLKRLCLRRNRIDGLVLEKLWSFFDRCPSLTSVDVSDNQIETLQFLGESCLSTKRSRHSSLRRLHLAGNPVLKPKITTETASHEIFGTVPTIHNQVEQKYLLQILKSYPMLGSVVSCGSEKRSTTPTSSYECLATSSLYSPQVEHALDLNRACMGKTSHNIDDESRNALPLSLWPTILERVARSNGLPRDTVLSCCRRCGGSDGSQLIQREASLMFTLLQGPVFASRVHDT
ncbi:leucine rich repeat lipoprotein [Nitzschia inconspicua]|uniref:Leucine rich repeat lipoprotein n=1 Tax=Nitzschia inconspicua TaxID=303405 RepID=A0A9K3L8I8_9STRA|nr:leucine rich repeat lipoprotein [Nitzschia inconspicua]